MLCFSTYINSWYVEYLPVFLFGLHRAYPEYHAKVFVKEKVPGRISSLLEELNLDHYEIVDDLAHRKSPDKRVQWFYDIAGNAEPRVVYYMWMLPFHELQQFEYVCTCDIDLLLLRENPDLLTTRKELMKKSGLPFSNFVRPYSPPKRLSGWQVFETAPYYDKMQPVIDKIEVDLESMSSKYRNGMDEEIWETEPILYRMAKEAFQFQDTQLPQNYAHHHGIHLGPFRGQKTPGRRNLNHPYWMRQDVLNDSEVLHAICRKITGPAQTVCNRFLDYFK